jgi:hypothetical protein
MAWKKSKPKPRSLYTGFRLLPAISLFASALLLVLPVQAAPDGSSTSQCVGRGTIPDQDSSPTPPSKTTGPEFKVQPLFGGRYRDQDWATLEVRLHNGPQPFRGEVCVGLPYNPDSFYTFSRPVELAPNAESRFFLYVLPSRFEPRYQVYLYNTAGQQIDSESIRLQLTGNADFTVGVITNPDKLNTGSLPRPGVFRVRQGGQRMVFVPLAPADIPDRDNGLDTFDAIILANLDPTLLTPAQSRMLLGWVEEGGQIWLPGGSSFGTLAGMFDASLLPATSQGTMSLSQLSARLLPDTALPVIRASGNQALTIQKLVPAPGSVVTAFQVGGEADGLPLVVGRALGKGAIGISAFDLMTAPFNEVVENSTGRYWGALGEATNPAPDYSALRQELFSQQNLPRQIAAEPPPDLPDATWVFIGLALYILGAVPGCYLIFNRLQRPMLAVLAAPLLAVVFGLVIYWLGSFTAARPVHLNRVALATVYNDTTPLNLKSFAVSIGAGSQYYSLDMEGQGNNWLFRPQNLVVSDQQARSNPPQLFVQNLPNSAGLVQSSFNPEGQFQAFGGQGWIDNHLPIETNLTMLPDGSGLTGTITNSGRWNLSDVTLILGDNYLYVGDLPVAEPRTVTFPFKVRPNFLPRQSVEVGLYGATVPASGSTVNNDTPDRWKRNLRWTLLNAAYLNGKFAPLYQTYNLYFTGWLEGSSATELMGGVRVAEGGNLREQDALMVIRPLNFSYQPSGEQKVIIPAMVLSPLRLNSSDTSSTSDGNIKLTNNGSVVMQYRLPSQAKLQPTRLTVFIKSWRDQRNGTQADPQLEIYNWSQQKWEVFSAQGNTRERVDLTGANVASYIDPSGGFIKLRASTKSEVYILQQLNLELEGLKL